METELNKIVDEYCAFMKKNVNEKLHSGEIISKCAKDLLEIDKAKVENDMLIQRNYLAKKIANDLLDQTRDMSMSRQYDCSPNIKEYTYLAFDLAFEYCNSQANKYLLPFLKAVIYYEKYNDNKEYLNKLKILLVESIEQNQKFLNYLSKTSL